MEITNTAIDGQELLPEIRNRIRRKLNPGGDLDHPVSGSGGSPAGPDFSALRQMTRLLQDSCMTLGRPPLHPPTLRGRVGGVLVRIVQRMLFWYTPQITGFHSMAAGVMQEHLNQTERLGSALAQSEAACATLQQQVGSLQQQLEEVRIATTRNDQALELQLAAVRREAGDAQSAVDGLIAQEEAAQARQREAITAEVLDLVRRLDQEAEARRTMEAQIADAAASARAADEKLAAAASKTEERLRPSEQAIEWLRASCMAQERRISVLLAEIRQASRGGSAIHSAAMDREVEHQADAWYVSFEDEFRGPREEIKNNARFYLPMLREAGAGSQETPVLDIGSGRGEWIEVLRDEGLSASGVDCNRAMVAHCLERGLTVTEAEAVGYLRDLPAESLGAVTAFHVIEHLPLPTLLDLLDEAVRVLKPGGIAIFETPNPSNILVGAHNFYLDPTHRNPLPSVVTKFIAEARGLCRVEVKPLHPCPEGTRVRDDGSEIVRRFNEYFYGPQDYAVVGYKV